MIYHDDYRREFQHLLERLFAVIDPAGLHSVSLGAFRLTRDHYRGIVRLYPDEPLFQQSLALDNGIVSYPREREREMLDWCEARLLEYIPAQILQPCEWHD